MTENFDGTENVFLLPRLAPPLKRRDPGWHTHTKSVMRKAQLYDIIPKKQSQRTHPFSNMLNTVEKNALLKIAREAIEARTAKKLKLLNPALESEDLKKDAGAFVSL